MDNVAQDTTLAIETRELNLWYGTFQALFDVDLEIKQGKDLPMQQCHTYFWITSTQKDAIENLRGPW